MNESTSPRGPEGVCFPEGGDGERSSSATGRAIFADSVRSVDPVLTDRIEHTRDWRSGYLGPIRDIVVAAAMSADAAVGISRDGLVSAHRRFHFRRDSVETSMDAAFDRHHEPAFGSVLVRGTSPIESELSLPYRGKRLFGRHLRDQVDRWVDQGIAEPSFGEAMNMVMDHPEWLDLRGVDIALLGAGAQMGPVRSLLRWGATVHAVDLQRPDIWQRLIAITRNTGGSLRIPIMLDPSGKPPLVIDGNVHPDDDTAIANIAGADLIARAPEVRTWLAEIGHSFVLGTYAYADGATHALLSMAADAVVADLLRQKRDLTLAYLATPTDAFLVPMDAVDESRRRWSSRGLSGLLQTPLRALGQFEPNYPESITTSRGTAVGLNDALISQQGPNYALAKRLQRWRALSARATGSRVSINVAPATRTASVVKNRALAAAYAGAGRFGIEVFEPATSTALMAALLVHDLRNPRATANAGVRLENPMDLFSQGANHGGLWRMAYSPRSVLSVAALLGMFESRA